MEVEEWREDVFIAGEIVFEILRHVKDAESIPRTAHELLQLRLRSFASLRMTRATSAKDIQNKKPHSSGERVGLCVI